MVEELNSFATNLIYDPFSLESSFKNLLNGTGAVMVMRHLTNTSFLCSTFSNLHSLRCSSKVHLVFRCDSKWMEVGTIAKSARIFYSSSFKNATLFL